ncbi:MAG: cell division protein ZapA [Pelagibacteraceae bacterium TMED233]|nr:MAG: cell division protein ZapA [Pelagibacteraceae bacterium TMED233]|tara:strand:- start:3392 stop:3838 length:447 start_codon:yes stop_codon:yes gene_type:complete
MANVSIKFNGKDYLLSCDDGQEDHLIELSEYLNKRFENLKTELGSIGDNKLLLLSSIKIIDEYYETKKKIEEKKKEFNLLSNKFKELRSLVLDYKETKDEEIIKLNNDLNNLKEMIDKNKNEYELMLEKTTESIEAFIKKTSQDKSVQ